MGLGTGAALTHNRRGEGKVEKGQSWANSTDLGRSRQLKTLTPKSSI